MAAAFAAEDGDGSERDAGQVRARDRLDELRRRAVDLAEADAGAYAQVLRSSDPDGRRSALRRATDVPLQVVEVAHEVTALAAPLTVGGRPALRGDATAAGILAVAGGRAAAHLVRCNVAAGGLDPALVLQAERLVGEAETLAGGAVS